MVCENVFLKRGASIKFNQVGAGTAGKASVGPYSLGWVKTRALLC